MLQKEFFPNSYLNLPVLQARHLGIVDPQWQIHFQNQTNTEKYQQKIEDNENKKEQWDILTNFLKTNNLKTVITIQTNYRKILFTKFFHILTMKKFVIFVIITKNWIPFSNCICYLCISHQKKQLFLIIPFTYLNALLIITVYKTVLKLFEFLTNVYR